MKKELKLKTLSLEEMLNRPEQEYNPSDWKSCILRMSKYEKIQFYVIEKDSTWEYTRFYSSYVADGIHFFNKCNPFSYSITNNPFCKVTIDKEGNLYKSLFQFSDGTEGGMKNCKEARNWFRKYLTPIGYMVSNCI